MSVYIPMGRPLTRDRIDDYADIAEARYQLFNGKRWRDTFANVIALVEVCEVMDAAPYLTGDQEYPIQCALILVLWTNHTLVILRLPAILCEHLLEHWYKLNRR